jgi:hypothetical protein
VLELFPQIANDYGDLPTMYRRAALDRFVSQPVMEESVKFKMKTMRAELAGSNPSPLELLLVDAVIACHQDYWGFAIVFEQKTGKTFTLSELEKWERILASKEARYLRAIAELARVRRLLNLPAPQVNINMPGGQQVNVSGKPD